MKIVYKKGKNLCLKIKIIGNVKITTENPK